VEHQTGPVTQAPPLAASSRVRPPAGYDCILLASFGGPEGAEDVLPFLRNVTRGRDIPPERLEVAAHHYRHFGGVSPINAQNRALQAALAAELDARGLALPVYLGNRFWAPYFADALRELHAHGHRRVLVLVTSAFSSYSGCRAYREDLAQALAETGLERDLVVDKVRQYFDHPGFVGSNAAAVLGGLRQLADAGAGSSPHVIFSAHSIPVSAAEASGPRESLPSGQAGPAGEGGWYGAQLREVAALIMDSFRRECGDVPWSLAFQSRSGPPAQPWLQPDINEAIRAVPEGTSGLVVSPLGFVSDHMEVQWHLDNEAALTARERGVPMVRVPTAGIDPQFVAGLVDLIRERTEGAPRAALTALGPWQDVCPVDCCLGPNPEPTVAGS